MLQVGERSYLQMMHLGNISEMISMIDCHNANAGKSLPTGPIHEKFCS